MRRGPDSAHVATGGTDANHQRSACGNEGRGRPDGDRDAALRRAAERRLDPRDDPPGRDRYFRLRNALRGRSALALGCRAGHRIVAGASHGRGGGTDAPGLGGRLLPRLAGGHGDRSDGSGLARRRGHGGRDLSRALHRAGLACVQVAHRRRSCAGRRRPDGGNGIRPARPARPGPGRGRRARGLASAEAWSR